MVLHNTTDIALVVQVTQRLILKKFMVRVSHGFSQYHNFNPFIVGRKPRRNLAVTLWFPSHFRPNVKCVFRGLVLSVYIPNLKDQEGILA